MIGEVVVDLGFADRGDRRGGRGGRARAGPADGPRARRARHPAPRPARARGRRALRPGLRRPAPSTTSTWAPSTWSASQAAKRYQAVPVGFTDDGALLLAMANPTNVLTIDDVGMMTGRRIRPAAASVEDLNLLLARLARMDESIEDIVDEEADDEGEQTCRSTRPTATRRSSSSCTRSSRRRSSRAPPTSTSTPRRATRACCSASTACWRRRRPSSARWRWASCRASRSWPTSTSPSGACRRTGASR